MLKHAKNQKYALEVPEGCVELTEEEQYYDGGALWFVAGLISNVIGITANYAASQGWISRQLATEINVVTSAVGIVTGVGGIAGSFGTMMNAGKAVNTALKGMMGFCEGTFTNTLDGVLLADSVRKL